MRRQGLTYRELGERLAAARSARLGREIEPITPMGARVVAQSRNPQAATLHDMAAALNTSVEELIGNEI